MRRIIVIGTLVALFALGLVAFFDDTVSANHSEAAVVALPTEGFDQNTEYLVEFRPLNQATLALGGQKIDYRVEVDSTGVLIFTPLAVPGPRLSTMGPVEPMLKAGELRTLGLQTA